MRRICRRAKAAVPQCERSSAALVHRRAASEPGGLPRTIEECSRDVQAAYDSIVPQAEEFGMREFRIQNSESRMRRCSVLPPVLQRELALVLHVAQFEFFFHFNAPDIQNEVDFLVAGADGIGAREQEAHAVNS